MKVNLNYIDIEIDVKTNTLGELSRRLVINFEKDPVDYYRLGEFLEFAERRLIKMKYAVDFDSVGTIDVSKHVSVASVVEEKNKYGTKYYVNIHFDCGLDKQIPCTQADFRMLTMCYNASKPTQIDGSSENDV